MSEDDATAQFVQSVIVSLGAVVGGATVYPNTEGTLTATTVIKCHLERRGEDIVMTVLENFTGYIL